MRKSIKNAFIAIAVVAGTLVLIGWVLNKNKKENEAKTAVVAQEANGDVAVKVAVAKKEVPQIGFSANGNFAPAQQINFSSENSGRVTKIFVDEGSYVKKGQVLATIKADALNVDLENAQANLKNAASDKQRFENAFKTGGVTQQQLEQARLAYETARARVAQASIKLNDANIKASINGIVNKRFIEPGAVVSPGTQLFEIVDVSKLKLNVTVSEAQVANLQTGDEVTVKASVYPDIDFKGRISFIAPKADNSLNFPIEIEIEKNEGNKIKAGMYGTAIFNFEKVQPVILVPRTAFVGSVNSNQLFVLKDSLASLRNVVAGRIIGEKVEVLQGLQEGETIITSGQINLSDGSKVKALEQ